MPLRWRVESYFSYKQHYWHFQNLSVSKYLVNLFIIPASPTMQLDVYLRNRLKTKALRKTLTQCGLLLMTLLGCAPRFRSLLIKWKNWRKLPHQQYWVAFLWSSRMFYRGIQTLVFFLLPFFLQDGFAPSYLGHNSCQSMLVAHLLYHPFLLTFAENLFIQRLLFRNIITFRFSRGFSKNFYNVFLDFIRFFNWPFDRHNVLYYVDWIRYSLYHGGVA